VVCAAETNGKFTIYISGKPAASESYTLKQTDGKLELNGSGNATIASMKIVIDQFDVVTNDKYELQSVEAKGQLGQLKMNNKVTFTEGKATNQMDTGQGPKEKVDEVHPDAIAVNSTLPLFAWTILAQRVKLDSADPQSFYAYIIGQAEVTATVTPKGKETVEFAGKSAELTHVLLNFPPGPTAKPVDVDVWVDDGRKIIKVAVPSMKVEAYQEGFDRKPPPMPAKAEEKP
jgi:hypothetical protein